MLRRSVAGALAVTTRIIPPRRTFRMALLLERIAARFVPRPPLAARRMLRYRVDGPREARLFRILDTLTRYGGTFEPVIHLTGEEHLDAALAERRGVLILGGHTMLNVLVARYLHDRGLDALLFAASPLTIAGTQKLANTGRPSAVTLLRAARALRRNQVVYALVDRAPTRPDAPFDVAEDLFHLAVKLRTHVLFVATRAGETAVKVKFERATGEPRTADELIAAFVAFLHEHIEATRPQFRS